MAIIVQLAKMIDVKQTYIYELKKWCQENEDVQAYADVFFNERLVEAFEMAVCFDDRIIEPICEIIKDYNYIEFTARPEDQSLFKTRLRRVVSILTDNGFINRADQQRLVYKMDNYYLKTNINKFIDATIHAQQTVKNPLQSQQIDRIWKKNIDKNFEYTWTHLSSHKIYDECIIRLIDICQPSIKRCSITKINEIQKYGEAIRKALNPSTIVTLQESFPQNQQRNRVYNESIDRYIFEKSIFLHANKRKLAYQQIRDIIAAIGSGNYQGGVFTYDLYGSMKTGFALTRLSDADIHVTPPSQSLSRDQKVHYLVEIYKTLASSNLNIMYDSIDPCISEKIRVPFIKMRLSKSANKEQNILKSIDIIFDTPSGIYNSRVLEMYAQSEYILKFGNLVKLWAKNKNIINMRRPTDGLSSYGVLLMALFYLIKTKQAPYVIESADKYQLEKSLLGERDYKSLLQNFKGFLEFYQPKGPFFTENMIVCLMEKPIFNGHYYDKYLINMYDFVDSSNPGRLSKCSGDRFFGIIARTYSLLLSCCDIRDVVRFEQ